MGPTLGGDPKGLVAANLFDPRGWAPALAAAPLAAALDAPQIGVALDSVPPETDAYLADVKSDVVPPVLVIGNLGFVSTQTAEELDAAIRP